MSGRAMVRLERCALHPVCRKRANLAVARGYAPDGRPTGRVWLCRGHLAKASAIIADADAGRIELTPEVWMPVAEYVERARTAWRRAGA